MKKQPTPLTPTVLRYNPLLETLTQKVDSSKDYIPFKGLTPEQFILLFDNGYLDPRERQNNAPTLKWIYNFIQNDLFNVDNMCLNAYFSGYRIANRDDARISIEYIIIPSGRTDLLKKLKRFSPDTIRQIDLSSDYYYFIVNKFMDYTECFWD